MHAGNAELFDRIYEQLYAEHRVGPELLAHDAEWVNPPDAVETGTRRGAAAFNEAIAGIYTGWEDMRFEVERLIERDDDVVALGHLRNRGRTARLEVSQPHGQIWTFRDGKAVRMRWFGSVEETLAAAGIEE